MMIAFAVLAVFLVGLLIYGLWQPAVRVTHFSVQGAGSSLEEIASSSITGTYLGIIPRNSTFFLPESKIRDAIMRAHPEIAAVALYRSGFSGLSIQADDRVPVARWCNTGSPMATASSSPLGPLDCYVFDATGFVFATSTAAAPVNAFVVSELASSTSPIGTTLPDASYFPAAFSFARQMTTFGASVTNIVFRGDEIDNYLASGTRITYVAGQEQEAFSMLTSARADFNLADGSVLYVDLRFPGKIYLKKK